MPTNLLCPKCKTKYDVNGYQPRVSSTCGHSVCLPCAHKLGSCPVCSVPVGLWQFNISLLDMIRIAEENVKELKKQSLLEKTQAVQEMERQKRVVELEKTKKIEELEREKREEEAEKERIVREMREQCRIAEEEKKKETRRAEYLESELMGLKKKCENELSNPIDHISCVDCMEMYRREKMKICVECMERETKLCGMKCESNNDHEEVMEESIESFSDLPILCGFCIVENHSNHKVIKYLPHTIREMFSSHVANGKETAMTRQNACTNMMEMGFECMEKWKQDIGKFVDDLNFDEISYRDSLDISSSLRNETDVIYNAANEVLPVLKRFSGVVQESSTRLLQLHSSLVKGTK